jgi:hypothetical protein
MAKQKDFDSAAQVRRWVAAERETCRTPDDKAALLRTEEGFIATSRKSGHHLEHPNRQIGHVLLVSLLKKDLGLPRRAHPSLYPDTLGKFSASPLYDRAEFDRAFATAKDTFPDFQPLAYIGYADGEHWFQHYGDPVAYVIPAAPDWTPTLGPTPVDPRPPSAQKFRQRRPFP